MSLGNTIKAVIPYSNGLDSRAVAGLTARSMGDGLVRVRLGSALTDAEALVRKRHAFAAVPFNVTAEKGVFVESTVRSRGSSLALVSGIAACIAGAGQVIVPESGQGSLGPSLATVGQAYEEATAAIRCSPYGWSDSVEALLGHRGPLCIPANLAHQGRNPPSIRRRMPERHLDVGVVLLAEPAPGQRLRS